MKRLLLALALVTSAGVARAQGIDLTWTDCVGTGNEKIVQAFTCSGSVNQNYNLIFQFKLPQDIPNFVGLVAYADYQSVGGAPLTPFWHFESGGCNNPATGTKGIAMFDGAKHELGAAQVHLSLIGPRRG